MGEGERLLEVTEEALWVFVDLVSEGERGGRERRRGVDEGSCALKVAVSRSTVVIARGIMSVSEFLLEDPLVHDSWWSLEEAHSCSSFETGTKRKKRRNW